MRHHNLITGLTGFHVLLFSLIACGTPSKSYGQTVEELPLEHVQTRVSETADTLPIAILYTSDDGSCTYCLEANTRFAQTAEALKGTYQFYTVTVNPWRRLFDTPKGQALVAYHKEISLPLNAVPMIALFADEQPIRMVSAHAPDQPETLRRAMDIWTDQWALPRGDIRVAEISPQDVPASVRTLGNDRPIVLTLTSKDPSCRHCLTGNAFIEEASRYLSSDFAFLNVNFDPWESLRTEDDLLSFLNRIGVKLSGLPTSLVFYKGQYKGNVVTLGQNLRISLSQALPLIKN